MSAVPRIYRATPQGTVTTADPPIDIVAVLHWMTTPEPSETPALAVAWTRTEVQIEWQFNGQPRRDWIDAEHVRRHGEPRPTTPPPHRLPSHLPHLDTRRRPRQ
jgi:hypothetical protein